MWICLLNRPIFAKKIDDMSSGAGCFDFSSYFTQLKEYGIVTGLAVYVAWSGERDIASPGSSRYLLIYATVYAIVRYRTSRSQAKYERMNDNHVYNVIR